MVGGDPRDRDTTPPVEEAIDEPLYRPPEPDGPPHDDSGGDIESGRDDGFREAVDEPREG